MCRRVYCRFRLRHGGLVGSQGKGIRFITFWAIESLAAMPTTPETKRKRSERAIDTILASVGAFRVPMTLRHARPNVSLSLRSKFYYFIFILQRQQERARSRIAQLEARRPPSGPLYCIDNDPRLAAAANDGQPGTMQRPPSYFEVIGFFDPPPSYSDVLRVGNSRRNSNPSCPAATVSLSLIFHIPTIS